MLLIIRDLSLQPFTLSSLTTVLLYFSIADVSSPNPCFTSGLLYYSIAPQSPASPQASANPLTGIARTQTQIQFPPISATDMHPIFLRYLLGPPYQRLPSRDETEIGAVLWWTAINGGYLSVLRLARNTTQKGAWSWEASIGHLIGYLIGHLLGCIIVL